MPGSVVDVRPAKGAVRYLSCLRLADVVALSGSPLVGAVFAMRSSGAPSVAPIALLGLANACLVAHVFMLNDWANIRADLADPNKSASVFTARGLGKAEAGRLTAVLFAASIALFTFVGPTALGLALAIAALSALYSLPALDWKGRPVLNTLAHLAGGALHFLVGHAAVGTIDGRALAVSGFFGLTFAAGHLTQETRDYQGDALNAIRTNAVAFGRRRIFLASVALFTLAYAALATLAVGGLIPRVLVVLVALYPLQLHWSLEAMGQGLGYATIQRLRTRYRLLYGVIGLAMVGALLR